MSIFNENPFRPTADVHLYQALYTHMRTAILSGELKGGMKLPSTRALAEDLNISRNTVINAYRQLLAEGYLESITGSGTFVVNMLPDLLLAAPHRVEHEKGLAPRPLRLAPRFSARAQLQLSAAQPTTVGKPARPFQADIPALDTFPYPLWTRLVVRQARQMPLSSFGYQDSAGYLPLRQAIAAHVAVSRQIHCKVEQIMIVSGSQAGLDLAARMLINPGDPVWMEDPGYPGAKGAFLGAGANIIPVPIDEDGLVVKAGIARAEQARLVYLTPSHQFPLGVTMCLSRRLELLDWAKRANAYILEDDYDSEFRFATRPLATLQGLDEAERVIYIGTFSKVLFPSIRIGYMILPMALVEPFLTVRRQIDIHSPLLDQAVLADFMTAGHFTRHLRRMRTLYAQRRSALLDAAREIPIEIHSPQAGIHCAAWLPDGMDEAAVIKKAPDYQLDLTSISNFCIEPMARKGLLLGYGGYGVQEIRVGVKRLGALLRSL